MPACVLLMQARVVQVFEIYLPQAVRSEYDKIFATENEQESSKCVRCSCSCSRVRSIVSLARAQARAEHRQAAVGQRRWQEERVGDDGIGASAARQNRIVTVPPPPPPPRRMQRAVFVMTPPPPPTGTCRLWLTSCS